MCTRERVCVGAGEGRERADASTHADRWTLNKTGEMLLWTGAAVLCCGCFHEPSQYAAAAAGPAFTAFLLLRVSGVPMLEKAADAKWGKQAAYVRYKQTTPMVLLRRPKRHVA